MAPKDALEGLSEQIEDLTGRVGAVEVGLGRVEGTLRGQSESFEAIYKLLAPNSEKTVLAGLDYRKSVLLGFLETIRVVCKTPAGLFVALALLVTAIPTGLAVYYSLTEGLRIVTVANATEESKAPEAPAVLPGTPLLVAPPTVSVVPEEEP